MQSIAYQVWLSYQRACFHPQQEQVLPELGAVGPAPAGGGEGRQRRVRLRAAEQQPVKVAEQRGWRRAVPRHRHQPCQQLASGDARPMGCGGGRPRRSAREHAEFCMYIETH